MIKVNEDLFHHIFYDFLISKAEKINDEEKRYFDYMIRNINKQIELVSNFMYSKDNAEEVLDDLKDNEKLYNKIDDRIRSAVTDKDLEKGSDIIEDFYKAGKENGASLLRSNGDKIWTRFDEDNLENLKKYNLGLIKDINSEVRGAIKEEIFTGIARSDNPRVIAENIKNIPEFEPLPNTGLTAYARAELIARTEVQRTLNEGHLQSYKDYGIKYVEIAPAPDACEECADWEGEVIDIDEANGLLPIHPNCRCRFIPITEGRDYGFTEEERNDPYTILPPDVSKLSYEDISTPEEAAIYYNVDYEPNKYITIDRSRFGDLNSYKGEVKAFYDKKFKTAIYVPESFNEEVLPVKRVLREYDKLPEIAKKNNTYIFFSPNEMSIRESFLGVSYTDGSKKCININLISILSSNNKDKICDNPINEIDRWETTLFHEAMHGVDLARNGGLRISTDPEYIQAVKNDDILFQKEGCSSYAEEYRNKILKVYNGDESIAENAGAFTEDVAEIGSMVIAAHNEGTEIHTMRNVSGVIQPVEWYIKRYPNRIRFIEKKLGYEDTVINEDNLLFKKE